MEKVKEILKETLLLNDKKTILEKLEQIKDILEQKVGETFERKDKLITSQYSNHIFLLQDGDLYGWGDNRYGQISRSLYYSVPEKIKLNFNIKFVDIACGEKHTLGLDTNGDLYSWGLNSDGVLGVGYDDNKIYSPTKIEIDIKFQKIFCGPDYCFAISKNGETYSWGNNKYRQLALEDTKNRYSPTKTGFNFRSVVCCENLAFGLENNWMTWTWGDHTPFFDEPIDPRKLDEFQDIYAGDSYYITKDMNSAYNIVFHKKSMNVVLPKSLNLKFFCGRHHFFVLDDLTGEIWVWGDNRYGQLGLGDLKNRTELTKTDFNFVYMVCGRYNTYGLDKDGELYGVGEDLYGQLLDQKNTKTFVPMGIKLK